MGIVVDGNRGGTVKDFRVSAQRASEHALKVRHNAVFLICTSYLDVQKRVSIMLMKKGYAARIKWRFEPVVLILQNEGLVYMPPLFRCLPPCNEAHCRGISASNAPYIP